MVSARSILNGVVGDYLVATNNELATPMTLLRRPNIPLHSASLVEELQQKKNNNNNNASLPIYILIHGLTSDERCWGFYHHDDDDYDDGPSNKVDYGILLERDISHATSLYLRYNTGLPISTNGKQLCAILQQLVQILDGYGFQIELTFICHSMGGLVARSATQYALRKQQEQEQEQEQQQDGVSAKATSTSWIYSTKRILFIGTPHQGSYWEWIGNILACALESTHYTKVSAAKLAKLRSQGIKDLRYGYSTLDDDSSSSQEEEQQEEGNQWPTPSRLQKAGRRQEQEQLLDWITYHTITGTVMSDPHHPINVVLGDGLVSKTSAQGKSPEPEQALYIESTKEFPGIHHNALQKSYKVYEHIIREWIMIPSSSPNNNNDDIRKRTATAPPDCRRSSGNEECQLTTTVTGQKQQRTNYSNKKASSSGGRSFASYKGVTSLIQDAIVGGVTVVEDVQTGITDDTYDLVKKYVTPTLALPLINRVHTVHKNLLSGFYGSTRYVIKGTGKTVKYALQTLEDLQVIRHAMED